MYAYNFNRSRAVRRWQSIQNFFFVTKSAIIRDKNELEIDEKRKSTNYAQKRIHVACGCLQVNVKIKRSEAKFITINILLLLFVSQYLMKQTMYGCLELVKELKNISLQSFI